MRRAAAMILLAVLVGGCTTPPPPVPVPPIAATPSAAAPPTPVGKAQALPVYYAAQTAAGMRLYREFHRVQTADPGSDAVREIFKAPLDPDYRTLWPAGISLRAPVTSAGGITTVDLAGIGGTQVPPDVANFAVQQLVLTVQGALQSTDPMRVLVDGRPVDNLWTVSTEVPVARGDVYALRSLVQIDDPGHGTTVGRDVVVSGEAAVFEATLNWQVLRGTTQVRTGTAMTTEGQRFAAFRFSVTLAPGEYTVRINEDDPSGGEGRPVLSDDKKITVS